MVILSVSQKHGLGKIIRVQGSRDQSQLSSHMSYWRNALNKHSGPTREGFLNGVEHSTIQRDAGTCPSHGSVTKFALESRDPKPLPRRSVHFPSSLPMNPLCTQQKPCSSIHTKMKRQQSPPRLPSHCTSRRCHRPCCRCIPYMLMSPTSLKSSSFS